MVAKATFLWVAGLLTIVPYSVYHLLYHAERSEYAFFIVLILFWIFGFWGIAGPIIGLVKVRKVFRAIERATSKEDLLATLRSPDGRDAAIDLISSDFHVPRFLATRVYTLLLARFSSPVPVPGRSATPPDEPSEPRQP